MTVEKGRIAYRKLPGRRRGIMFGSSVWLGPDHLLLVKSARFREEYKRFYFRDIQAIVTAKAPRFHLSTRSALVAALLLGTLPVAIPRPALLAAVCGAALLAIALWIYISAAESCRTRIYTAVSSDELTSVYRNWTARKFLEQVQPHIAQAQGVLQGNWAEAVDGRQIGPLPEGRVGLAMPGAAVPIVLPSASAAAPSTAVSNFFVGCLCLGGLANVAAVRLNGHAGRWVLLTTLLVQLAAAVPVLVQNYRGKLGTSMRNLAIAALVSMGVWYYAVQMGIGIAIAYQSAQSRSPKMYAPQAQQWVVYEYPLARGSAGGLTLLLGLAGVILSLRGERAPQEKVSFNV
jgi:hypothetical protein